MKTGVYQGLTVLEICSFGYLSYDILCWLKHTCLIYKKMNVYWFLPFNKRFSSSKMKVIYLFGLIAQVYFVQCRREDKVCMDNLKFCIPVSLFLWDKIFTFFHSTPFSSCQFSQRYLHWRKQKWYMLYNVCLNLSF